MAIGWTFVRDFAARQLPVTLPVTQHCAILAALAHHPVAVFARLPVYPAGRQPRRAFARRIGSDRHHVPGRAVAWRELDVHHLGATARLHAGSAAAMVEICGQGRAVLHNPVADIVCIGLTFLFVSLAWVFFRAPSINDEFQSRASCSIRIGGCIRTSLRT